MLFISTIVEYNIYMETCGMEAVLKLYIHGDLCISEEWKQY